MIKNAAQLKSAKNRLEQINNEIEEIHQIYVSDEANFYIKPLEIEKRQIEDDVEEYIELQTLPLDDAILRLQDKPILIDDVGQLLSKLRLASKLTQSEMADRLGWEQSNLSRFESENYSSQTVNKIVEFASALGVYLHVIPSLVDELQNQFFISHNQFPGFLYQTEYASITSIFDEKHLDSLDFEREYRNYITHLSIRNITKGYSLMKGTISHPKEDIVNAYHKPENYSDINTTI